VTLGGSDTGGPAVTRLKLTGFRNYARLDLSLDARPVASVSYTHL